MSKTIYKVLSVTALATTAIISGMPLYTAAAAVIAVAVHELGHLATAEALGIHISGICIESDGLKISADGVLSYRNEWLLCAVGPAANLLFSAGEILFLRLSGSASDQNFSGALIFYSVSLAVLNLIPIEGFDGGRMLYCFISGISDNIKAYRILSVTSFISIVILWLLSSYLVLRTASALSSVIFSLTLFFHIFMKSTE